MPESVRLYLDEDTISRGLIAGLRARHVDVLTAQEAGTMGPPDEVQLTLATSQQRVLFTFNTRDFVQLHVQALERGLNHSGIVVSDQLQVGVVLRRMLRFLDSRSAAEMSNRLEFLGNWR